MKKELFILFITFCLLNLGCDKDQTPKQIFYSLTITVGTGGAVDVDSGIYLEGTELSITATPDTDFEFEKWSGDSESTSPVLTIIMDKPIDLQANFKEKVNEEPNDSDAEITYFNADLIDDSGYILAIENGQNTCYLIDHDGTKVYSWTFDRVLGQDIELTPEGNLLGLFKVDSTPIAFGGQSGIIREIDKEGNILWEYLLATENEITHHDLTRLPNGNVLVLVWERIPLSEATAVGLNSTTDIFTEKVVEINPDSNEVVWEWRSWDHIVQDFNTELASFGDPAVEKNKINILYANSDVHEFVALGDVMHANGIDYLPEKDIIALSINFFSEVWIIDHSTTSEEASTGSGGQFDKGGDLLYRFGNQKVFGDSNASHLFDFNHNPTFLNNAGEISLMIFNNNESAGQSSAMEFLLPEINGTTPIGTDPTTIFEFTDSTLFFPRIGSVSRLPNGNTLICEGDFGYWEVTSGGEVVWKYDGLGKSYWRGVFYSKTSPEITNLNL
ncbi:MAG: aryl-sulfate sulfotransferase [Bacteroidota bacterium]|nr:aryl-sulfate sulfotransferase [Bacteroidota bacterium]